MVDSLRSNSFNFIPAVDVPRERGGSCPLALDDSARRRAMVGTTPARSIFVQLKDRMRLFRTETRDFSDAEIARVKELGQVYADVSAKHAPDDFSRDLRKLRLLAECARCPFRSECAGAHVATKEDVFGADDARARAVVRKLAGAVLDVGAGHAPYASELEASVRAGKVRYLALDPDTEALSLLRTRWPWAKTWAGALSTFGGKESSFRHVLFLRSVNHVPDVDAALDESVRLLEVGGTLLLVDDVPFGLVRERSQAARAEAGPAAFEHHRRDGAEQLHLRCQKLPLRLIERRDVEARGSNQWLLHYERRTAV